MRVDFAGRSTELAHLEDWWNTGSRPALMWGRRRVGKTTLTQRFAEGRRSVFHTSAGRPRVSELAELSQRVAGAFPDALRDLAERPYRSWDEAFDDLSRRADDRLERSSWTSSPN